MLGNAFFYHSLTRKYVSLFGRLFDNISIIRKNDQTGEETQRFLVPIIYAPKEKMITRLVSDPDLQRQLGALLPRMSFEIASITYDPSRKQNSLLKAARANTATHVSSCWMGVPYDINFNLFIYARNINDANQIMEQILPFFNPDFTVTTNMIPDLGMLKDIPVTLNTINDDIQYEGDFDSVRYVYKTINFTIKAHYWGPVSYPKIIRDIYVNIYNDPSLKSGYIARLNTANTSGDFKHQDVVYQGSNYHTATAYGIVMDWNVNNGILMLGATHGQFRTNSTLHAVSTNATCNLASFVVNPIKLTQIRIQPDPIDAEPTDSYGYFVDVTEFPDTLD